jgi:hypothetical protein
MAQNYFRDGSKFLNLMFFEIVLNSSLIISINVIVWVVLGKDIF